MPAPTGCQRALGELRVLAAALGFGVVLAEGPNVRAAPLQHGLPEQEADVTQGYRDLAGLSPTGGARSRSATGNWTVLPLPCLMASAMVASVGEDATTCGCHPPAGTPGRAGITAVLWENPDDPSTKNVVSPTRESQDSLQEPSP